MAMIEINWSPDRRTLRNFGLIALAAFGGFGAWIFARHHFLFFDFSPAAAERTAYVLWGAAGLCGLLAAAAPAALRPLYLGLTFLALPIGFVLSYVILGIVFYGLFTLMALVFRLIGRDAMTRRFDRDAKTYWVRKGPAPEVARYFRQS